MRRHLIGIIAVVLLAGAAAFQIWPPTSAAAEGLYAACCRVGALMAVIWLAYREVARLPGWILSTVPVLVAVLALRPKWFVIAVPVVIVLAILNPRKPARR